MYHPELTQEDQEELENLEKEGRNFINNAPPEELRKMKYILKGLIVVLDGLVHLIDKRLAKS